MRIAIDFDNTIVSYGDAFARAAAAFGFHASGAGETKTALRDRLRAEPDGDRLWTIVQARVYGPDLIGAPVFPGVHDFLALARRKHAQVFLVSHKSQFAAADPRGIDLRAAAREWLRANHLIGPEAFDADAVYFESTRSEKIARIAELRCTHAVDDLVEVFEDPGFPADVRAFLFDPDAAPESPRPAYRTWADLAEAILGR